MKKTFVAALAIAAVIVVSLAATAVYLQYQPSQAGSGRLAIFGTDPPVAASGVTSASVHYSSVAAHAAGSSMASGWAQVSGSGTMNLMSSAGTAQTMAVSQVSAGTYDAFRFNIDSAKVTYQGHEYVATVTSATLTAQSQSRVVVNQSSTAAAVVDMRTIIMNTGNSSSPQFILSATAVATSVPPSALASISIQFGGSVSLSGIWWSNFVASTSTNVNFVGILSSNSMVLSLQNMGSADAEVREIIVTPISTSAFGTASLPASFAGSAVFIVDSAGSLQSTSSLQATALLSSGARIASSSSSTLTYSGNILLNFDLSSLQVSGIVSGQQYLVTVVGANTYSSAIVVAG